MHNNADEYASKCSVRFQKYDTLMTNNSQCCLNVKRILLPGNNCILSFSQTFNVCRVELSFLAVSLNIVYMSREFTV